MAITQTPTILFTAGRACTGPLAVVLHQYDSGLGMLDSEMARCPRRKPAQSPGCHTSFHYGVDGCIVHQYVANADTAWGFGVTPPTCPPPVCPPNPCESCTGETVDQYQTDLDGNPPVLPPFVLGPDGTVNCGVLHVALATGINPSSGCCHFLENAQAYGCYVKSLCQIFQLAGLIPSQTTLLVHCEELPCLDIDQLILDILACINAPPPPVIPCQCTATPVQFCAALDNVPVSETSALFALGTDCEFHPIVGAAQPVVMVGVDTTFLDTTVVEAPANTFSVSVGFVAVPACTDGSVQVTNFNGEVYLGDSNSAPGTVAWKRRFSDPVQETSGGVVNLSTLRAAGKNVLIVDSNAATLTLTNPPSGTCAEKHLYIKNINALDLQVNSADLIDGQPFITLDGVVVGSYPFGNDGGEAVHLVWRTAASSWAVL